MTTALWLLVLLGAPIALFGLLNLVLWLRVRRRWASAERLAPEVELHGKKPLPGVEPTWYPPTPPQAPRCGVELYGRVPCSRCRASPLAISESPQFVQATATTTFGGRPRSDVALGHPYDSAGLTDEERAAEMRAVRVPLVGPAKRSS